MAPTGLDAEIGLRVAINGVTSETFPNPMTASRAKQPVLAAERYTGRDKTQVCSVCRSRVLDNDRGLYRSFDPGAGSGGAPVS